MTMRSEQGKLLHSVGYCCLQAYLTLAPNIKKQLARIALRPVEYAVLSLIQSNPGINQKRLGETIRVSPPNMATLLDRMQINDLVQRRRNPQDRRSQILTLTPHGTALLDKAHALAARADQTPALTAAERTQLTQLLAKVFQD